MGKKDPEKMAQQRKIFVKGCADTNNIPEQRANDIFDLLEKFAGYGFNKSHSAAYGLVTYQTAYLKANYPVEFMCGVLSNEISNTDKIAIFVGEVQAMGLSILPPHVNHSGVQFLPEAVGDGKWGVRYGLAAIKGVGEAACGMMLAERDEKGPFKSLEDFARRVDSRAVNKRILEGLIKSGAFDWTGEDRASLFVRIDQAIAAGASTQRDKAAGQFSLFGEELDAAPAPVASSMTMKPEAWSAAQMLNDEKELLGFYVSGHPLDRWRSTLASQAFRKLGFIEEIPEKDRRGKQKFGGIISELNVKYTKTGKQFAIMRLEDFTGSSEVMVWGEEYEKFGKTLEKGSVVEITAKIEKDNRSDALQLVAQGIKPLPEPSAAMMEGNGYGSHGPAATNGNYSRQPVAAVTGPKPFTLRLDVMQNSVSELQNIHDIVVRFPGRTPLVLSCRTVDGIRLEISAGPRFNVEPDDALIDALTPWL
jgi:DNA polymerase-3 subunit alpha